MYQKIKNTQLALLLVVLIATIGHFISTNNTLDTILLAIGCIATVTTIALAFVKKRYTN